MGVQVPPTLRASRVEAETVARPTPDATRMRSGASSIAITGEVYEHVAPDVSAKQLPR
jgi:hypothetical protein